MDPTRRPKSLIDSLGEEIVRIITPVSVCMFLVVILVSILNSSSSTPSVSSIATIAYSESGSDSSWDKLKGALLNAVVFVAVVTVVTFVLVLLFYLRCTKFLKIYMGFSACIVLGFMGGEMALVLVSRFSLPVDCVTFGILLFNFTVVGALAVFMSKMAILVTQAYLVVIGMLVAYWFTMLPEWTTWALLIAMSLYDLAAVLLPGGPLRLLVELAMSRDEDIPALVYEARPVTSDTDGAMLRRRVWRSNVESDHTSDDSMSAANSTAFSNTNPENSLYTGMRQSESGLENVEAGLVLGREAELSAPLIERRITIQSTERERQEAGLNYDLALEGIGLGSSGAIKLGLGDFIFYSVLVGRAAMYDFMTVYACYLAIIAGLGVTLMLLAVYQKALPALPVSVLLALHFNLVYHYLWQISAFNIGLYPSLAISERLKVDSSDEILSAIFVKVIRSVVFLAMDTSHGNGARGTHPQGTFDLGDRSPSGNKLVSVASFSSSSSSSLDEHFNPLVNGANVAMAPASGSAAAPKHFNPFRDDTTVPASTPAFDSDLPTSTFPATPSSSKTPETMPKLDVQATQSPAVQIMERPGEDASPYRIPDYVFDRTKSTAPVEWSSASNESLFSIQMGHMSFTGDLFLYNKSEDLGTHNKPGEVGRHDKSGEIGTHHNKELGASNKSGEFGSYSSSGELGYSKSVDLGWYNLSGELATPGQMKPGSGQITNSSGRPQPQANASGNVGTNNSFFSQDFHRGEPPRLGPGVGASETVAAETMKEIIRENEQKHNHMKNPSLENGCSSPSTVCHLDQRTSSTKSFAFPVLAEEDKSPSSSKHSSIRASSQQPHPPQQPQTLPAAPANSTSTVASTQPRRSFFSCFSCCPIRIR